MPGKKKLLVVDDEPEIIELLKELLPASRFELTCETDGTRALDLVAKEHYDLLMVDVFLDRVHGEQILTAARRSDPDAKVIMMSAYGDMEMWVDLMNKGAVDLVPKPFQATNLRRTLSRFSE